jgi:hypothetical protein
MVQNKTINIYLLSLLISAAFLHTVLRGDTDSPLSLYVILAPFCFVVFLLRARRFRSGLLWSLISFLYLLPVALLYSVDLVEVGIFTLHAALLGTLLMAVSSLVTHYGAPALFRLLRFWILVAIATAVIEIIFSVHLPNVNSSYSNGEASAFFWNQNEFGLALAGFVPIALVFEKNFFIKVCVLATALLICYWNDAKISFMAIILCVFLSVWHTCRFQYLGRAYALGVTLAVFAAFNSFFSFRMTGIANSVISFDGFYNDSFSFVDAGGSFSTRIYAAVFGLREWIMSYGLGIGPGNSLLLLKKQEYLLLSAKSLHNPPIQFLVEFGFLAVFVYYQLSRYYLRLVFRPPSSPSGQLRFLAIPTYLLASTQSSIGILSNYFFAACVFFVVVTGEAVINCAKQPR